MVPAMNLPKASQTSLTSVASVQQPCTRTSRLEAFPSGIFDTGRPEAAGASRRFNKYPGRPDVLSCERQRRRRRGRHPLP